MPGERSGRRSTGNPQHIIQQCCGGHFRTRTRALDQQRLLAIAVAVDGHAVVGARTLRQWMIQDGRWLTRPERKQRVHQPRQRRDCYGELIQIDGCEHPWFEARGPKCTLLVFVEAMKELPATLLLRPANFDTLATWLYAEAARGTYEEGALAALAIVLAGLAPVLLLARTQFVQAAMSSTPPADAVAPSTSTSTSMPPAPIGPVPLSLVPPS